MKLFLLAGINGGFKVEVRLDTGATEVVNMEQFQHELDSLTSDHKYAGKDIAWLNDDNQMETAHGVIYEMVRQPIRGRKKPSSSSSLQRNERGDDSVIPSTSSQAPRQKFAKRARKGGSS